MGCTCWVRQLGFPIFPTKKMLNFYLRPCKECEEEEGCPWVGEMRENLKRFKRRNEMIIDWEETGCKEDDWRAEVGSENPMCPILNRNGYLPVSLAETKRIFDQNCDLCSLFETPPCDYPSCPWAVKMAQELLEAELI